MRVLFTRALLTSFLKPSAALCVVLFVAVASISGGYAQALAPLYTPKAPIPKGAYKSWSLFLINNPEWVLPQSNEKIKALYDQFDAFGKAIGPDHVAVWFWSENLWASPANSRSYKAVDVIRSAAFCSKLKLLPSRGPYVVVTTDYPGTGLLDDPTTFLPTELKNYEVLELNNASADEITRLLTAVADRLASGNLSNLNANSETYWRGWQRAFEAVRDFLTARQVTLTIKTPFFEAQIK